MSDYGSADQAITITLASLGASSYRQSNFLDIDALQVAAVRPIVDIFVLLRARKASGSPSGAGVLGLLVAGTTGGTVWPDGLTGVDSAHTTVGNIRTLGSVIGWGSGTDQLANGVWSLAAFFGGMLPSRVTFVVQNAIGVSLSGTAGDHDLRYQVAYAPAA